MRPESDISPAAPGLASGAWPLAQPRSRQPCGGRACAALCWGSVALRLQRVIPLVAILILITGTCPGTQTTTTQRCATAPWGDGAFFWSCRREQSEHRGEAGWGWEELMPSGLFCRGWAQSLLNVNFFSPLSSQLPLSSLSRRMQLNFFTLGLCLPPTNPGGLQSQPCAWLISLCSQAPATVLGT